MSANLDHTAIGPVSVPIQVKRMGCAKNATRKGGQQKPILMARRDRDVPNHYQELGLEFTAKRIAVKACKPYAGAPLTLHREHLVEPHPATTRADALASLDVIERHAYDSRDLICAKIS